MSSRSSSSSSTSSSSSSDKQTDNKPKFTLNCSVCGRAFSGNNSDGVKANLRRHLQIHDNSRKFKCKYCDAEMSTKQNLTRHIAHRHKQEAAEDSMASVSMMRTVAGSSSVAGGRAEDDDNNRSVDHQKQRSKSVSRNNNNTSSSSMMMMGMMMNRSNSDDDGSSFLPVDSPVINVPNALNAFPTTLLVGGAAVGGKDGDASKTVASSTALFSCSFCSASYKHQNNLRYHIRQAHPEKAEESVKRRSKSATGVNSSNNVTKSSSNPSSRRPSKPSSSSITVRELPSNTDNNNNATSSSAFSMMMHRSATDMNFAHSSSSNGNSFEDNTVDLDDDFEKAVKRFNSGSGEARANEDTAVLLMTTTNDQDEPEAKKPSSDQNTTPSTVLASSTASGTLVSAKQLKNRGTEKECPHCNALLSSQAKLKRHLQKNCPMRKVVASYFKNKVSGDHFVDDVDDDDDVNEDGAPHGNRTTNNNITSTVAANLSSKVSEDNVVFDDDEILSFAVQKRILNKMEEENKKHSENETKHHHKQKRRQREDDDNENSFLAPPNPEFTDDSGDDADNGTKKNYDAKSNNNNNANQTSSSSSVRFFRCPFFGCDGVYTTKKGLKEHCSRKHLNDAKNKRDAEKEDASGETKNDDDDNDEKPSSPTDTAVMTANSWVMFNIPSNHDYGF